MDVLDVGVMLDDGLADVVGDEDIGARMSEDLWEA